MANLQNRPFLEEYFKDLKFTIDTIRQFANGTTVSLVIEPDLLAYMMQTSYDAVTNTYREPAAIPAMTDAAYTVGLLPNPGEGNRLPNTLPGFIEAINRGVRYLSSQTVDGVAESVNLEYGWKFNLWATPTPGGGSIAKVTDTLGWEDGRAAVQTAASTTANWYKQAGILRGVEGRAMDFIALDKYGTDGRDRGGEVPAERSRLHRSCERTLSVECRPLEQLPAFREDTPRFTRLTTGEAVATARGACQRLGVPRQRPEGRRPREHRQAVGGFRGQLPLR